MGFVSVQPDSSQILSQLKNLGCVIPLLIILYCLRCWYTVMLSVIYSGNTECDIPWQCHCIQNPLCRGHLCTVNTGRNHQSVKGSVHLHQWPPLWGPTCSSGLHVWCHFQTNLEFEFFQPAQLGHSSAVRSVWSGPGRTYAEKNRSRKTLEL